jgi:hypothetical protein
MKCKALEGLIGDFSYQGYLKAKILHALACQDQLRKQMKQSLKTSPQVTPIAVTSDHDQRGERERPNNRDRERRMEKV